MKLLIVEDNASLRKTLLNYFREDGFAADSATDGAEGFHKATNWDYDAIILDAMLPEMDGFTLVKKLRDGGHSVPVLMLTARTSLTDRLNGLDSGADDYLAKPFEMEELAARVRALIRRRIGMPHSVFTLGPVTLDTARKIVLLDGKPLELTAREYALTEILILHADRVVTREFLYEKLFDERDETLSNMLDVYIYKLRQKFGRDFIQTRRGQGYQFCAG
ncbi:MAG: response regulator transcription factor [Terrimicrobiaceae bacterium]|nr:response regulator transcription factor [Terrimicrobiaceae bacterium]